MNIAGSYWIGLTPSLTNCSLILEYQLQDALLNPYIHVLSFQTRLYLTAASLRGWMKTLHVLSFHTHLYSTAASLGGWTKTLHLLSFHTHLYSTAASLGDWTKTYYIY